MVYQASSFHCKRLILNNFLKSRHRESISESGRSMVEMLGVLAIVGLLSIGGIIGFRSAMSTHEANELIYEAQMHTTLLAGESLLTGLQATAPLRQMSYDFTYKKESNISYSLSVSGIGESVCKKVHKIGKPSWAELVLINAGAGCKSENNLIAFYVNTMMNAQTTNEDRVVSCETDADCGECGTCGEQKICVFSDGMCANIYSDKPYCNRGVCQVCDKNYFYIGSGGTEGCRSCTDGPQSVSLGALAIQEAYDYCSICSNRTLMWIGVNNSGKYCAKNCTGPGEFLDVYGNCQTCSSNSFFLGWSSVNYNHSLSSVKALLQQCHNCEGMFYNNKASANYCYSCTYTSPVTYTSETECTTRCPGIRYAAGNNTCTLCPAVGSNEWVNELSPEQKAQCCPAQGTDAWNNLTGTQQEHCTPD